MPHSTVSTRDEDGRAVCAYCGAVLRTVTEWTAGVCASHSDLLALEPFDDRYTLASDEASS